MMIIQRLLLIFRLPVITGFAFIISSLFLSGITLAQTAPLSVTTEQEGQKFHPPVGVFQPDLLTGSTSGSLLDIVKSADPVVQAVFAILGIASVLVWGIFFAKFIQIIMAKRQLSSICGALSQTDSLKDALLQHISGKDTALMLLHETGCEVRAAFLPDGSSTQSGLKERVALLLSAQEIQIIRQLSSGIGNLATISSTAPFIGLFGTVWGIMNSFIGIAQSNTTNLAVVAPGIAEALLATAAGLLAAIPAVIFYNFLVRAVNAYKLQLGILSSRIRQLISRDLDRGTLACLFETESQTAEARHA